MSTPKYTPGPWVRRGESVNAHRPHECGGYNEESIFALSRPPAERIANASLVVAAPDMRECLDPDFLTWICDRLVNVNGDHPESDFILKLRKKIEAERDAIAKAEGKPGEPEPQGWEGDGCMAGDET
jgi:hypothetical protein